MKTAVSIMLILTLPSLLPFAFAQSMITVGLGSDKYTLGQPILAQGMLTLGQNDPKGLPVSVELYDSNGNVVDAQTLPVTDNQFTYSIPTGVGTKVTELGKFTIVAYYGNPTPMLLNTPQSTKVYFEITNAPTITPQQSNPQQSSLPTYNVVGSGNNASIVGLVLFMIVVILAVIAKSRRKKSEKPQQLPRRGWSPSQRSQILARQGGRCAECGEYSSSGSYHFDHIDNNHNNNDLDNGQALCPNCHDRKSRGLN